MSGEDQMVADFAMYTDKHKKRQAEPNRELPAGDAADTKRI